MLLIPLDSRFRGNDDCGINQSIPKFVARMERTTAGMQEVEQRMEQLPSGIREQEKSVDIGQL
jgi:hypothetical protein